MKFKQTSEEIIVGAETMRGTLYRPEKPGKLPAVVIFHGRGSQQSRYFDRAEMLAKAGFLTLIFSFRGCGQSDGKLEEQTIKMGLEDALAGYDFLLQQPGVNADRIGVWGGSYGGYLASLVTGERTVKSLILSAPAIYKDEWWDLVPEIQEKNWEKYSQTADFSSNKSIKAISQYTGDFLLIEHEFDKTCPRKLTRTYFDNAGLTSFKERAIIHGVDHRLVEEKHRQQSNKITTDWFLKTL